MIDLDSFVTACHAVLTEEDAAARVAEAMRSVVAEAEDLSREIERRRADGGGPVIVHRSDALTVLGLAVPAGFVSPAHNHRMWAVVGIYQGAEDNVFYQRQAHGLKETGRAVLSVGDCFALPPDAVHRISNTGTTPLLALHAYGGDLLATPRSQWDDATGDELPFGSSR